MAAVGAILSLVQPKINIPYKKAGQDGETAGGISPQE